MLYPRSIAGGEPDAESAEGGAGSSACQAFTLAARSEKSRLTAGEAEASPLASSDNELRALKTCTLE